MKKILFPTIALFSFIASAQTFVSTSIENKNVILEEYTGINNVKYKHVYYIGKLIKPHELYINEDNKQQYTEIKNIKWVNEEQATNLVRQYNRHKQNVIKSFFNFMKEYQKDIFVK